VPPPVLNQREEIIAKYSLNKEMFGTSCDGMEETDLM
jgi:hypothetical protein